MHFFNLKKILPFLIVAAAAILTHINTLDGEFILDDYDNIVHQERIKTLSGSLDFFKNVDIVDKSRLPEDAMWRNPYYRPLFMASFAIDYMLYGMNPAGYHLSNIFLHMLASVLVLLVAKKITGDINIAFLSGIIFAVHPAHSEAVTWIGARCHIMAAIFMLLALYFYLASASKNFRAYLFLSALSSAFALLSLEMPVTMTLIILSCGLLITRDSFKSGHLIPFLLVLAFYFIARKLVMGASITEVKTLSYAERLLTAPYLFASYIKEFFLPFGLKVSYNITPIKAFSDPRFILSAIFSIAAVLFMFHVSRTNRAIAFASLWFFLNISTVLNVIQEVQPFYMSARYLYIPSIGLSLISGIALFKLTKFHRYAPAIAIVPVLLFSLKAWQMNKFYLKDAELKSIILPVDPAHRMMLLGLHIQKGEYDRAMDIAEEVLKTNPSYTEAYLAMASIYNATGKPDMEEEAYEMAVKKGKTRSKEIAYSNLGIIYAKKGKYPEAVEMLKKALELRPSFEEHYNLGIIYRNMGMFDKAQKEFEAADSLRKNTE